MKKVELTVPQSFARRLWRYGPLLLWMAFIYLGSTNLLAASNTSGTFRRLLLWLWPAISEAQLLFGHFVVRKCGHLTEYAILALLAARAFASSSRATLRRHHLLAALALAALYSLADEYHQSFVPSRGASLYDSLIDTTGAAAALLTLALLRRNRRARRHPAAPAVE